MHDMDGRVDMVIDGGPCCIGVESTIVECDGDDSVTILRPGGITMDMLKEVVTYVRLDTNLVTGQALLSAGHEIPPLCSVGSDDRRRRSEEAVTAS